MDNETKTRVLKVLKKVTGREFDYNDLDGDLQSQLTLDSIQIVELLVGLEQEFNAELPLSMMTARSGNAFFRLLEEELNKR